MATESVMKYKFISQPDAELMCVICLDVAEEPWQHAECGKLLCKKCLDQLGKDKPCPNCRREKPQFFPDIRGKRAIQDLAVKCENIDRGCDWVGTVGALETHVATCELALLSCPNKCEEDSQVRQVLRKDLSKHIEECPNRKYTCADCELEGTYTYITTAHHGDCPVMILPCPKRPCTEMMQRQYIDQHIDTVCKYTVVPCKYKALGCESELKREDMAGHEEDDNLHLHMAIDTTAKLSSRITTLEDDKAKLSEKITAIEKAASPFTFKLEVFEYYMDREDFISPYFYTSPKGHYIHFKLVVCGFREGTGSHMSLVIFADDGGNNIELSWPFKAFVTISVLNQLQDRNHYCTTIRADFTNSSATVKVPQYIPHSQLEYDPRVIPHERLVAADRQYLKDHNLYFSVAVKEAGSWLKCTDV